MQENLVESTNLFIILIQMNLNKVKDALVPAAQSKDPQKHNSVKNVCAESSLSIFKLQL